MTTTATRPYRSGLRRDQADATRTRILEAAAGVLESEGPSGLSNRKIAEAAGVTEMTVYRHFPSRAVLDEALWKRGNELQGVAGGFPDRLEDIAGRLKPLYASFDQAPGHILGIMTTDSGRKMRASQDDARRLAFETAVAQGAPDLSPADRTRAAAVLQCLYSAYPWLSLREQWGLDGPDASDAVAWAVRTLIKDLQTRGGAPLATSPEESSS